MKKRNIYDAFGLIWECNSLDIDELNNTNSSNPDVVINEEISPLWPNFPKEKYDTDFVRIRKNDLRIKVDGIGIFRVINGREINYSKENKLVKDQDIRNFLLGSSFGGILIQRGFLVLHANALVKENKCIICAGKSGSGKSTLAYSLLANGWELISDDLVVIDNDLVVLPGIQRVKLWSDAMHSFGLNVCKYNKVRDGLEKYLLSSSKLNIFRGNIKIDSIYLIGKRMNILNKDRIQLIDSEQLKLIELIKNIYRPRFVKGLGAESSNFKKLSKISKEIKIYSLNLPCSIHKMQEFVNNHF